jgi:hypothetical protein
MKLCFYCCVLHPFCCGLVVDTFLSLLQNVRASLHTLLEAFQLVLASVLLLLLASLLLALLLLFEVPAAVGVSDVRMTLLLHLWRSIAAVVPVFASFLLLLTSLLLLVSLPLQQTSQLLYLVIADAFEVFSMAGAAAIVWSACCCCHPVCCLHLYFWWCFCYPSVTGVSTVVDVSDSPVFSAADFNLDVRFFTQVHCSKSSKRFSLKYECSLVFNKYFPSITLV